MCNKIEDQDMKDEEKNVKGLDDEGYELTFDSGNMLKIEYLFDIEFAHEIVQFLMLDYENRIRSYWLTDQDADFNEFPGNNPDPTDSKSKRRSRIVSRSPGGRGKSDDVSENDCSTNDDKKKKEHFLYIAYDSKFDAVFSLQSLLENYGCIIKEDIRQLSKTQSDKIKAKYYQQEKKFTDIPPVSKFVHKSYTVVLKNILIFDNLTEEEQYVEMEQDLKSELSRYGDIVNIFVPRPINLAQYTQSLQSLKDNKNDEESKENGQQQQLEPGQIKCSKLSLKAAKRRRNLMQADPDDQLKEFGTYFVQNTSYGAPGHIFVKFKRSHHADRCIHKTHKRRSYKGREIHASLWDDEKYKIQWSNQAN